MIGVFINQQELSKKIWPPVMIRWSLFLQVYSLTKLYIKETCFLAASFLFLSYLWCVTREAVFHTSMRNTRKKQLESMRNTRSFRFSFAEAGWKSLTFILSFSRIPANADIVAIGFLLVLPPFSKAAVALAHYNFPASLSWKGCISGHREHFR